MSNRPNLPEDDQFDIVGLLGAWILRNDRREYLSRYQKVYFGEIIRDNELVRYKFRPWFGVVVLEFRHNKRIQFRRKLLPQILILADQQRGEIAQNNAGLIRELNDYLPN